MIAPKSTQTYQEIYRLIVQLAVMVAATSKTEMTPCGHVYPDRANNILMDIEDEFHFILKCPFYTDIRNIYIYIGRFNHKQCKIVNLLSAFGFRLLQSIKNVQLKSCVNIAWVVFINTPLQTENGNLC